MEDKNFSFFIDVPFWTDAADRKLQPLFILFFEKKRNYLLFSRNHKLSAYINIFIFRLGVKRQLKIWRPAQERR